MSRQYKNGKCSCWATVDKQLAEHNTQLSRGWSFSGHNYLCIGTEKIDDRKRKPPKQVFASYCPICGGKLKERAK